MQHGAGELVIAVIEQPADFQCVKPTLLFRVKIDQLRSKVKRSKHGINPFPRQNPLPVGRNGLGLFFSIYLLLACLSGPYHGSLALSYSPSHLPVDRSR